MSPLAAPTRLPGPPPKTFIHSSPAQITAYIVVGFAAIGAEIENPFGYDRNDLNLDHYTSGIIARELDAIIARPFAAPEEWVFSDKNMTFGPVSLPGPGVAAGMWMGLNARELEVAGTDVLRKSLAGRLGSITGSTGSGSPKGSTKRSQPQGSGREHDEEDRRDRRRSAEWGTFEARWESDV